jgi:NAD(P)-dependent dehydrogenase (short-subunit alcohol dehydrogenase family)
MEPAKELCTAIKQQGGNAIHIHADLQNLQNADEIFAEINEKLGKVSLLINNAAIFENDNFPHLLSESLNRHMQINCIAPIILAKSFVEQNQNKNLNIINLLDCSATLVRNNFFSYDLSKSALLNATKQMALQLAPSCRVNAISPGHVLKNERQSDEHFLKMIQNSPMKIATTTEQICNAIEFILKTESMTGNNIILDAGVHLT